jgi:hypothetical protein
MNTCTRLSAVALSAGLTLTLGLGAAASAAPAARTGAGTAVASAPVLQVPAGFAAARAALAARSGIDSPAAAAVQRAVTPSPCAPTDLDAYVGTILGGLTRAQLVALSNSGALDFPTYDALVFGTTGDPAYALTGSHAHEIAQSFRDAQRFWDVQTSDIQLMAMHGPTVLTDQARLVRLLTVVYGLPAAQAGPYAAQVIALVKSIPALQGGNNPIFTLNAFAFSGEEETDPLFRSLPDKLIFGDGILDFLDAIGIGDVGTRAVLGHEFGHHVQFEDDLFDSPLTGAEATRRTELMADAFGSYFATSKRGLALNAKRVLQVETTFYEVGDCSFDSPGHHGTPLQRERASQWGVDLAASQQKKGQVLPSLTVARLFDAALPKIVTG